MVSRYQCFFALVNLSAVIGAYQMGPRLVSACATTKFPDCLMSAESRGFIGLGIMGQGMARQLCAAGIPLVVWTRNENVATQLKADVASLSGASIEIAESPKAVVEACTRTFVMLPTPEACHELYHREDGILAAISDGKEIVDCATLRVEDMEVLSEAVHRRGGLFAEAPVSGSKGPAATGQLIFMVAGDEAVFKACTAEWEAMGKAALYCGEVGKATQMKLVVNMVMGAQLAALAEGLALGSRLGLDLSALQSVLDQGAMASPMVKLKGPLMAKADYTPNFPLKYALKDLEFALDAARASFPADDENDEEALQVESMLPVSSAATALFTEANEAGLGDLDFAAVYDVLRD